MRRPAVFALPLILAVALGALRSPGASADERLHIAYTSRLDSLAAALDELGATAHAAMAARESPPRVAPSRRRARLAYKSVEGLLEYFDGMTASFVNGRENAEGDADANFDAEEGAPVPDPLSGFAGIDAALDTANKPSDLADVERRAISMARTIRSARSLAKHVAMDEARLFDAARLELARITTLGLGGIDAADLSDRAPETAAALRGLRAAMASSLDGGAGPSAVARRETDARFARAIARLETSPTDEFDSFTLIAEYVYPLARSINAERRVRHTALPASSGAWRASSAFIFDRDAFDPLAFAADSRPDTSAALVALGEALFSSPVLSGDGTRSCASCHHPDRAFTEDRARTATIDEIGAATARNTPTLINAALQPALFADLRVRSLEAQVAAVVANPAEMRGNLDSAAAQLSRGGPAGRPITSKRIQSALAAYVRSLTATGSRFDQAIRGDRAAMSPTERHGFNVFMGKARCGTCHFAPLFGGTLPPDYWSTPAEVIGVPVRANESTIDPDLGQGAIDGQAAHRHAFRTPALRNVAVTAPYMHNGAFRTLEEVVDFYDRGGGAGLGIDLPNQTLPRRKLGLTAEERRDLVAFLQTLTDTGVRRARVVAPRTQSR